MGIKIFAAVVVVFFVALLYGIYWFIFYNSDKRKQKGPDLPEGEQYGSWGKEMIALIGLMEKRPFEEVRIRAYDGTELYGRYYHVRDGAPLQLQFHGYRGGAFRDMCGAHRIAREHGMNSILVDQRAHGKSGGHTTTFGIRERKDVVSWIAYANKRFGPETPIILTGVSMGASTVLMAADEALSPNVKGIIADCPFSSPMTIIRDVAAKMHGTFLVSLVPVAARLFGHFNIYESSALEAVGKTDLPILLIHGGEDRFVPLEMSRELKKAGKNVQLEIFPGAAHGISYLTDTERYTELELDFIKRVCAVKT